MRARILQNHNDIMTKMMKDKLLSDLVNHRENNVQRLKEGFSSLRLRSHFTSPAVAVIQFTSGNAQSHMRRQTEQLRDYLQDELDERAIVFIDEAGLIVLLFSWGANGWIEVIQRRVSTLFNIDMNIGVGLPYHHLTQVHHSYRQAVDSLKYIFYIGNGNVVYSDPSRQYQKYGTYPTFKEKEMYELIKSTDQTEMIKEGVDRFYDYLLQDGLVEINEVREITLRLIIGVEQRLISMVNESKVNANMDIMSVVRLGTLQEIKQFVYRYFVNLRTLNHDKNDSHHYNIIEKSIDVMEKNCQRASLNYVAKKVYMTPTYLSLLFKTKTGKTFIEVLTEIRIQKAKHMLKTTRLKNYEVAEKVGYQDPRYFSQIFKKRVGLSPSEYREWIDRS